MLTGDGAAQYHSAVLYGKKLLWGEPSIISKRTQDCVDQKATPCSKLSTKFTKASCFQFFQVKVGAVYERKQIK